MAWLIALAALGIVWWFWSRGHDADTSRTGPEPEPSAEPAMPVSGLGKPTDSAGTSSNEAPAPDEASSTAPGAAAMHEVTDADATSDAGATMAPSAAPEAADATAASDAGADAAATRKVLLKVRPAGASIYRRGRKLGVSPLEIEMAPGEKRVVLEVYLEGYHLRRVVVDGSEPVVVAGLIRKKPQSKTAPPPR